MGNFASMTMIARILVWNLPFMQECAYQTAGIGSVEEILAKRPTQKNSSGYIPIDVKQNGDDTFGRQKGSIFSIKVMVFINIQKNGLCPFIAF